jgi:transcriptional regulator with XRE-family HTH domain
MLGKLFPSRPAPVKATTQAKQVRDRQFGGSTKEMARQFGVSQRTVERWVKGDRTPRGKDAAALEAAAAKVQTTERGRERRVKQYEALGSQDSGISVTVSLAGVKIGGVNGSDVVRAGAMRAPVTLKLTGDQAAALAADPDGPEGEAAINDALSDYFNRTNVVADLNSVT